MIVLIFYEVPGMCLYIQDIAKLDIQMHISSKPRLCNGLIITVIIIVYASNKTSVGWSSYMCSITSL